MERQEKKSFRRSLQITLQIQSLNSKQRTVGNYRTFLESSERTESSWKALEWRTLKRGISNPARDICVCQFVFIIATSIYV